MNQLWLYISLGIDASFDVFQWVSDDCFKGIRMLKLFCIYLWRLTNGKAACNSAGCSLWSK